MVKPKPLALATNAAATPLPNGSDGNYCIFVYGVQANDIVEQVRVGGCFGMQVEWQGVASLVVSLGYTDQFMLDPNL